MEGVTAEMLLADRHFNEYSIGAFLGYQWTDDQKSRANGHAQSFFEEVGLFPTPGDVVLCEREGVDDLGNAVPCGRIMFPQAEAQRRLGFRWRCKGSRYCRHREVRVSPFKLTLLSNCHIEFRNLMKLMYGWMIGRRVSETARHLEITEETAVNWFRWLREAVTTVAWHDYEKIGGPGDVVELDETFLFERKNNKGRMLNAVWVFGGISRVSGKRFAMRVIRRDAGTLNAEIMDSIAPGSIICSDGWAAYNNIINLPLDAGPRFYREHGVVIHQTNFLHPPRDEDPFWRTQIHEKCRDQINGQIFQGPNMLPDDPVHGPYYPFRYHTQKVERSWLSLKDDLKSTRSFEIIDQYIGEYLYRENILKLLDTDGQKFRKLVEDLTRVYPGINTVGIKPNKPKSRMFADLDPESICGCDPCMQD